MSLDSGSGSAPGAGPLDVHSHDNTSSTTSCTVRPVVSRWWASSACRNGDASRVESIRSRRATPSGASSCAPPGPLLGRRGQVHLELGVGEHDRADVAALHHPAAVGDGPVPLAPHELGADVGVGRHDGDGVADLGRADLVSSRRCRRSSPRARRRCRRWRRAQPRRRHRRVRRRARERGRRRRGTSLPYRAVRGRDGWPPRSTRWTCRRPRGRRWRRAGRGGAVLFGRLARSRRREAPEVVGEARVAGRRGVEPGDQAPLARARRPAPRPRPPSPCGGRPGCRTGRRAAGRRRR